MDVNGTPEEATAAEMEGLRVRTSGVRCMQTRTTSWRKARNRQQPERSNQGLENPHQGLERHH